MTAMISWYVLAIHSSLAMLISIPYFFIQCVVPAVYFLAVSTPCLYLCSTIP